MNCQQVQDRWNDYINGRCSPQEEQLIDEHLQHCSSCEARLDHLVNEQKPIEQPILLEQLSNAKQHRLIKKAKWKNRLANLMTGIAFVIVIVTVPMFFTATYYEIGDKADRARLTVQTVTQMTMPNLYVRNVSVNTNWLFNLDIEGNLSKTIGNDSKTMGQLDGKMMFNQLQVNRHWVDGDYREPLYFIDSQRFESEWNELFEQAWETLGLLPEGTVSEIAITFDKTYTIDEVYELLDGYDFNIEWYGIETAANRTSDSPYIQTGNGTWGLHEWSVFDFSVDGGTIMLRGDGEKREAAFKKGLAFLVENEKYVKQYGWWIDQEDLNLAEKLAYVEEHGVKTYGLVVTGPTKELLRLQEVEPIIFASIGEIAFWNWMTRNAGASFSD